MLHLQHLNVLVLGLGESGLAMALWCARHGAKVRVWDSREPPPHAQALHEAAPQAALFSGALDAAALGDAALVLKSPGLAPHDERIAPVLAAARERGVPVQGELDLFNRALADLKTERAYAPQVLAITGTNGKTTTTAMTALLVQRAGRSVGLAGNIGPTLLDTLWQQLQGELPQVWVLELSSFQLHDLNGPPGPGEPGPPPEGDRSKWQSHIRSSGFEPSAATVLNISQDHLDWHGDMAAYTADKARIFGTQGLMILNRDDEATLALRPAPQAVAGAKPKPGKAVKTTQRAAVTFGLDAPTRAGDFGLVVENGMAWLVRAQIVDETRKRGAADAQELYLQHLMPADALRVRGRHNAANALAALALATAVGCPLAPMLHGLREYRGEPHRVEFIGSVAGIEAFDDSKGTNVGATVAALDGLGADQAPGKLVLILGGDGKGQDFSPLLAPLARHARAVALIGRDAGLIEAAIASANLHMQRHTTLEQATAWCFEQAQPGDAVLLSPACASLDMFRNYGHRAEVFVAAVQALAHERGELAA